MCDWPTGDQPVSAEEGIFLVVAFVVSLIWWLIWLKFQKPPTS